MHHYRDWAFTTSPLLLDLALSARAALAVDTDGNDGPTDAAGGLVTGATASAIRDNGLDPVRALDENDSDAALEAGGALLRPGPTGTNVNDLRVVLVARDSLVRSGRSAK